MSKGGKVIVGVFVAAVAAVSATIHVYPIAVVPPDVKERKTKVGQMESRTPGSVRANMRQRVVEQE